MEHDEKQVLVSPARLSPLDDDVPRPCAGILVAKHFPLLIPGCFPHPYKATTELELCLPLSPARGLVSPRGGRAGGSTGQCRDPKRGCGAGSPVGGTHFWDDLQPFLGREESLRDPGGFGGHFGGSQGHWMIPEDWSILWENWRDPGG